MHTTIDWTTPITWLIAGALLLVLLVQLWLISRNQSLASARKWLRLGLNGLLWFVLAGYFLQVHWSIAKPAKHALLLSDDVPVAFVRQVKDSLHIQESFTSRNFKPAYDSVTLIGQRFPIETLAQLSNVTVQWVPYNQPNQLQEIRWKGIVRQGEIQRVTGRIQSSEKQVLRLRFGSRTLDSVALHEGITSFSLQFPAFAKGRSQIELVLGNNPLDTIRFFTRPTESLSVQFLLNSPDFESRTLAAWLGKQGHTVTVTTTLSKNISSQVSINKALKSVAQTSPDLVITEPANAASATVRKAVADGKSVLFINLTNPEIDCRTINQALGSRWQVQKIASQPLVPAGNGLNALPYRFADHLNQFAVLGYPIAIQRTVGRVGISLLTETFPLSLSGDSVAYNRIWTAVLARLFHADKNTVQVDAPVYSGSRQGISINNPSTRLPTLRIGPDTLPLTYSSINDRTAIGKSLFSKPGWQPLQDSLGLYVTDIKSGSPLADRVVVSQFMQAHSRYPSVVNQPGRTTTTQLPNWVWLLLILTCFTALWIEPKIT